MTRSALTSVAGCLVGVLAIACLDSPTAVAAPLPVEVSDATPLAVPESAAAPLVALGAGTARRLAAEDFAERQAAQQRLMSTPDASALMWLVEIARGTDPEASLRAVRVLEHWLTTAPLELADQAEQHLEDLSRDASSQVMRTAEETLSVHRLLRQQRAMDALKGLGAKVDVGPNVEALRVAYNISHAYVDVVEREMAIESQLDAVDPEPGSRLADPELSDPDEPGTAATLSREEFPKIPRQVFLTAQWTGGDEGTRHLRRLSGLDSLQVYVINGCGTSVGAVQAATADIGRIEVQPRGPSLGVGSSSSFESQIGRVLEGGAAERAGLKAGDHVVAVGDKPVESFVDLVETIKQHNPGDKVTIRFVRGGRPESREVTLGDWTEVDTERELWRGRGGRTWMPPPRMFFPAPAPEVPPR